MLTATRGSSALKLDYAPQKYQEISERITREHYEQERRREQQERLRREASRRKAQKLKFRVMLSGLVCITFIVFSVLVLVYSKISSMTLETNRLKGVVTGYETQKEQLKLDISMSTDLELIKEKASEELNMGAPKEYQIYKITLKEADIDLQEEQPVDKTIENIRELLD